MRSLFVRIFLWFWLAMAAVVVVLVVTSPFFTRSRPGLDRWHEDAERWTRRALDEVADRVAASHGDEPPAPRVHGRDHGEPPPQQAAIFVLDEDGRDRRGRPVPPEVVEIAGRAVAAGREVSERTGTLYLLARPVSDGDGSRLVAVAAHHRPPRLVHLLEPRALAWRLGILVVIVGALSFWLARYLSSPVAPLRRATRRLSGGDLTARVEGRVTRRRDEIGELARDFDAMAERIEVLVGSQRRLLRDVSHELRSPLARLAVALELARTRSGDGAVSALDRIELEIARLDELVGRLLLLQRLEAGVGVEAAEPFDLRALLAEVVEDAGFEAAAAGRSVTLQTITLSPTVVGDPGLLRSAFENLVRNAVHHTGPGSSVEVGLAAAGDAVEVTVRDHGHGVPDEDLDRIFEPFARVDETRDRSSGGVGLGLAIAARAIRAHGGAVRAANHPDGGLVVTVRLPFAAGP